MGRLTEELCWGMHHHVIAYMPTSVRGAVEEAEVNKIAVFSHYTSLVPRSVIDALWGLPRKIVDKLQAEIQKQYADFNTSFTPPMRFDQVQRIEDPSTNFEEVRAGAVNMTELTDRYFSTRSKNYLLRMTAGKPGQEIWEVQCGMPMAFVMDVTTETEKHKQLMMHLHSRHRNRSCQRDNSRPQDHNCHSHLSQVTRVMLVRQEQLSDALSPIS